MSNPYNTVVKLTSDDVAAVLNLNIHYGTSVKIISSTLDSSSKPLHRDSPEGPFDWPFEEDFDSALEKIKPACTEAGRSTNGEAKASIQLKGSGGQMLIVEVLAAIKQS